MNLGDELRATLNLEADMQITSRPDVERLIIGGRVRRRRRNVTRALGAALAVVLVGSGAYAVTQGRSEWGADRIANQETVTPEASGVVAPPELPETADSETLEPGTYRVIVGLGGAGQIRADLTFDDPGWISGDFPLAHVGAYYGGFGVYRPTALAAGTGCVGDATSTDLGTSPQALAQRLAKLPGSTVVQPVTPGVALGRDAFHLRLRFPDVLSCAQWYQVAETWRGSRGITYEGPSPTVLMDFWVVEYDGVPVVLDSWHQAGAPGELVDRIARARDSITFVGGQ